MSFTIGSLMMSRWDDPDSDPAWDIRKQWKYALEEEDEEQEAYGPDIQPEPSVTDKLDEQEGETAP